MNEREFDQAIIFRSEEDENGDTIINATFELQRTCKIAQEILYTHRDDAVNRVKLMLKKDLARYIYEDRRRELAEALKYIAVAEPYSNEFQHARSELLRVALRQPDATLEKLLS